MEKAFHALGAERLPKDHPPHSGRTLKWEYGLRPDLLAVTHVYHQAGSSELIIAAKGAPEAIAELCQLSESHRADNTPRRRRHGPERRARARRRARGSSRRSYAS
jgi:P-type Ca2+ transporter type 2C